MSTAAARPMTTEQLLALPRDGVERWLIRGKLREKPKTVHNRWHSRVLVNIGYWLTAWLLKQLHPRGQILGGQPGCRLRRSPDSTVGIDEKVDTYLDAGVRVIWVIDPHDRTVLVYRPNAEPELLTPGKSCPVIRSCLDSAWP